MALPRFNNTQSRKTPTREMKIDQIINGGQAAVEVRVERGE
jgi:hypothetical protein